ncbi:MAG: hypothetical protein V1800_12720 [Candidatus Latescibacterota bacterium]
MSKIKNINTTNIRDSIRLGCQTMCADFNVTTDDIAIAHLPGRFLNALLNAQDAAGVAISEERIQEYTRTAFLSYNGPVALPMDRETPGGPILSFCPHNVREGFHALYSLVRYRNSREAHRWAEASIKAVFEFFDPDTGWDFTQLEKLGVKDQNWHDLLFMQGLARSLGPLLKLYRATGFGPALELAIVLKEKLIRECFTEDGAYNPTTFGPGGHSITCVMSSLAQLADVTRDSRLMDRVKAFYDSGLWELRDAVGWSIEVVTNNPGRGESNNSGDILETALILGRWGHIEAYHDAERIIRAHLLPSQVRDPSPGWPLGAWGFPSPYGQQTAGAYLSPYFNPDVVGGVVGSLCEAYRDIARTDEAGHWVNLLFDHETDAIAIESPYTHSALRVMVKRPAPLAVRIPAWVDLAEVATQGVNGTPRFANGRLFIAEPPVGQPITFHFPLKEQEIVMKHGEGNIRVRLRGDEVVAMDNLGTQWTFFDPIR